MAPPRKPGMDHDHYAWSPWVNREPLAWPRGARVALSVIVNLEYLDWDAPAGAYQSPGLYTHLAMQRPIPEIWSLTHREYGHRVGIFRVLDLLDRHGIRPTVAIDAMTARNYPYLVRHCIDRGVEFIAHGVAVSRMITSRMGEDEERRYIAEATAAVSAATGAPPEGWLGPEYGESTATPRLLAEAGYRYLCDWANDDRPYAMTVPEGELHALPVLIELDDVFALRDRRYPVDAYTDQIKEAFDVLYRDAATGGRVMVLSLHPWLIGQPCRIGFLDQALGHIVRRHGVWAAAGAEIIEWCREQPEG